MGNQLTRREMLAHSGLVLAAGALMGSAAPAPRPFRISLNTSTISGYRLPVEQQIELCAEAGFDGIELWMSDVSDYLKRGGTPEELQRRLQQHGLVLENMIAFSTWAADDPDERAAGVQQMRRDMEVTARLGGKYIAAPVQGVASLERERLPEYGARYRVLLETGAQAGVTPLLELWGAGTLNRLSDTAAIAIEAGRPDAAILLDFYHLYRGGNSFEALRLLNGAALPVFHINDYPASIPREQLQDADRVFPGDGHCAFGKVLPVLRDIGFRGTFSLELFNRTYWDTMDARTLVRRSYEKTAEALQAYPV